MWISSPDCKACATPKELQFDFVQRTLLLQVAVALLGRGLIKSPFLWSNSSNAKSVAFHDGCCTKGASLPGVRGGVGFLEVRNEQAHSI
jgi:hypothetical protein